MTAFAILFGSLLIGHALGDGPLQSPAMSRAKRPGGMPFVPWQTALVAHASVHGLIVMAVMTCAWLFAGGIVALVFLGWAEALAHAAIDGAKCRRRIGLMADQLLHVVCKAAWAGIAAAVAHG